MIGDDGAGRHPEPDVRRSTATSSALILLIGLAVGVDYSLFYMRREREERAAGRSQPRVAIEAAAATSGRAVLISGLTVIDRDGRHVHQRRRDVHRRSPVGTITVVAVAMFGSLTVLPAMLAWLGDRIDKGRIPFLRRAAPPGAASRGSGRAIVDRVMRRPVARARRSPAALLVALAIPALSMKTVVSRAPTTCRRTCR